MTCKWIMEMSPKIPMQLYKYCSCNDNNLAMRKKTNSQGLRRCPNVNALSVRFLRKLLMQLCAYPVRAFYVVRSAVLFLDSVADFG